MDCLGKRNAGKENRFTEDEMCLENHGKFEDYTIYSPTANNRYAWTGSEDGPDG